MSAGQIIGAIAGVIVGVVTENPQLGFMTYSAIAAIGAYADQPDRIGPRLNDLRTQVSSYGAPIPFEYGTNRHAGIVIWPNILEANEHQHAESSKGGPDAITYTYTMSFAILICEGPIAGIRRIWANKKLVYDASETNGGNFTDPLISGLRIYLGTSDQDVDPLIEATEGTTPAYRGYAYVVFEDYDVTEMNGRVPQFEFETVSAGELGNLEATPMGACGRAVALDLISGNIWSVDNTPNESVTLYITSPIDGSLLHSFTLGVADGLTTASSQGNSITFVPTAGAIYGDDQRRGQFWVASENGTQIIEIDPDTYSVYMQNNYRWEPVMGSHITWTGLIHYSANHNRVYWARTNVSTDIYILTPIGDSTTNPVIRLTQTGSTSVYGTDQIITLSNGYDAVLATDYIRLFDSLTSGEATFAYHNVDIGTNSVMSYDSVRNRILIITIPVSSIIELDLGTGVYTTHDIVFPDDISISASQSFNNILYHENNDKYYITAHHAGKIWTLYTINPNTYEIETYTMYNGPTNAGNILEIPNHPEFLAYADSGTNLFWKLPLFNPIIPHQVVLGDIVEDICVRAGLDASDLDVTQLDDLVDGYIVPRQVQARAAIEPLQSAYFFDAVESDDKIKFVKRGELVTITNIPKEKRAAHEFGQDAPDNIAILRTADLELPFQCDVEYADVDADHLIGNQYDRRITKDTKQRVNISLPIVMTAVKAKQIARVSLYEPWRKHSFKWTSTREFAYIEPTDLVYLPTDSAIYVAKVTNKREQPNGIIEWEAIIEDIEIYSQDGSDAVPLAYSPQTIFVPDITILRLLDIPILRDEDDNAGYYVAMGGTL